MARAYNTDVETRIREALADPAASYADIGEKIGVSADTVRRRANRWGLDRDTHARMTDEQHAKIRRMLNAGCWTHRQIARGVGCSHLTVAQIAHTLGIDGTNRSRFKRKEE